ncbi:OLC1v1013354C6 [Oldenlandia corymbosa var. corymbosa]|nr:OLC1v1013354C6 [Oldenlandia corymbosa var. corymbosa]
MELLLLLSVLSSSSSAHQCRSTQLKAKSIKRIGHINIIISQNGFLPESNNLFPSPKPNISPVSIASRIALNSSPLFALLDVVLVANVKFKWLTTNKKEKMVFQCSWCKKTFNNFTIEQGRIHVVACQKATL